MFFVWWWRLGFISLLTFSCFISLRSFCEFLTFTFTFTFTFTLISLSISISLSVSLSVSLLSLLSISTFVFTFHFPLIALSTSYPFSFGRLSNHQGQTPHRPPLHQPSHRHCPQESSPLTHQPCHHLEYRQPCHRLVLSRLPCCLPCHQYHPPFRLPSCPPPSYLHPCLKNRLFPHPCHPCHIFVIVSSYLSCLLSWVLDLALALVSSAWQQPLPFHCTLPQTSLPSTPLAQFCSPVSCSWGFPWNPDKSRSNFYFCWVWHDRTELFPAGTPQIWIWTGSRLAGHQTTPPFPSLSEGQPYWPCGTYGWHGIAYPPWLRDFHSGFLAPPADLG